MVWRNTKKPRREGRVITVGKACEMPEGSGVTVELKDTELALFRTDGEFYALENFCPHRGAPLADGALCGPVVECAWHGWRFDLRTGACLDNHTTLETYPVTVTEGNIEITI